MNRESNSPKLAVLDEIERIAGAKIDPALKYSLRFTAVSHLHLIRLRDFVDDAVKRAAREAASTTETAASPPRSPQNAALMRLHEERRALRSGSLMGGLSQERVDRLEVVEREIDALEAAEAAWFKTRRDPGAPEPVAQKPERCEWCKAADGEIHSALCPVRAVREVRKGETLADACRRELAALDRDPGAQGATS